MREWDLIVLISRKLLSIFFCYFLLRLISKSDDIKVNYNLYGLFFKTQFWNNILCSSEMNTKIKRYTDLHIYMYTHVCMYMHIYMHAYMYKYVDTGIYICVYIHLYMSNLKTWSFSLNTQSLKKDKWEKRGTVYKHLWYYLLY